MIAEQSERLSRMVRQLLAVSRLDSGLLHPSLGVFALGPRVRRAWEALGADGVSFEFVDRAAGWLAVADPGHVDQVIWALLDNAVKHGGGGPVTVRVEAQEAAARVLLTVANAGPGIGPGDRARLFERYARGEAGARDGTGLGLYVARGLARASGGDLVFVERPAAEGAEFVLSLPAERATEA
jgi:signal transduction histidine kinase